MDQQQVIAVIGIVTLILWFSMAAIAGYFSESHGRPTAEGFFMTVAFGPFGFLAAAILPGPADRPMKAQVPTAPLVVVAGPPSVPAKSTPKTTTRPTN